MLNIPIYRARKLHSDEYVEGHYTNKRFSCSFAYGLEVDCGHFLILDEEQTSEGEQAIEVDLSTLAIHFPDMIDSEGNKIFASLSESGKGGDIVECWTKEGANLMDAIMIYKNYNIGITYAWGFHGYNSFKMIDEIENKAVKVIGIQK